MINVRPTSMPFDTKDIAEFNEKNPTAEDKLVEFDKEVKLAIMYAYGETLYELAKKEDRNPKLIRQSMERGIKTLYESFTLYLELARADGTPTTFTKT